MRKFFKLFFTVTLILGLMASATGLIAGIYFYLELTKDLPRIEKLSDYQPKAVTTILADDGTLMAELFEERRYPASFEEIPQTVKNAFLAAEDANFYSHPGIDFISILRAVWVNIRHKKTAQGASTITQQIVKSLLLTREKTYERKAKEAILSYRLEHALNKDEILTMYLNEIYLGSRSYGIKAAAKVHFHKKMEELTLAEAAYLAGLPQKPGKLSLLKYRDEAFRRQRYVLDQMVRNNFVTRKQADAAKEEEVVVHLPNPQTIFSTPYFTSHVIRNLDQIFPTLEGDISAIAPGGYVIRTTGNVRAYDIAKRSVQRGLRAVDKRRGWRGVIGKIAARDIEAYVAEQPLLATEEIDENQLYKALVQSVNTRANALEILVGGNRALLSLADTGWAKRLLLEEDEIRWINPLSYIRTGDLIEVSLEKREQIKEKNGSLRERLWFKLDQTPELQSAFAVQNVQTGELVTLIGGYDYSTSKFNRATQGMLQPGSSFKPFIYLAALDVLGYTPSTIVPDSPISMMGGDGKLWTPQNYDRKFLGPITMRTALQRSRNVISVYLLTQMGIQEGIKSARNLGITTPIPPNWSISLGTAEVRPIELIHAYGAFAAEGWLADQYVVRSIEDRKGNIVYRKLPKQRQAISENSAFLMANMMKGVVERGTAQVIKKLGKPVAGKTGTTNDQMDAWFVGYTPQWVAGAWVGFDVKKTIGARETGGRVAGPIFLHFMEEFLRDTPPLDFEIPDGVIPIAVNLKSGHLAEGGDPDSFMEYFRSGTEPKFSRQDRDTQKDYLSSDEF